MRKQTADERSRMDANIAVRRLVAEQVADLDPDAFEIRPPWPGAGPTWEPCRQPLALPAITAARRIVVEARRVEAEAIDHARGQGKSWAEIARALGEPLLSAARREAMSLTEAGWRWATFHVLPGQEIPGDWVYRGADGVTWRCWTCTQTVTEAHPDNGPDAEAGHAPGCARLAARKRRGWR